MKIISEIACLILTSTFATLCLPSIALAERYRVFENPGIDGLWVDGCILENGEVNCSKWAKLTAANAFCRQEGYAAVNGTWYTGSEPGNHTTYRYTIFNRDGRKQTEWRTCEGCSFHITKIECKGS